MRLRSSVCLLVAIVDSVLAISNVATRHSGAPGRGGRAALRPDAGPTGAGGERDSLVAGGPGVYHIEAVHGACLEASRGNANGGRLEMSPCNRSKRTQQWTYTASTNQIRNMQGLCLHAEGRGAGSGHVAVGKCNTSELDQQWWYDTHTRQIRSRRGTCLDTAAAAGRRPAGRKPARRTPHLWTCESPEASRQWKMNLLGSGGEADNSPMPAFPFLKFVPLQVRGQTYKEQHHGKQVQWRYGWVQIADIHLRDVHGRDYRNLSQIPVIAINEFGSNRPNESVANLVDGNPRTKWLDFARQPVTLRFYQPVHVKSISFVTANDCPWRDPVQWVVKGSYNGYHWLDLANTMGQDAYVPSDRGVETPSYVLTLPPVSSTVEVVNGESHPLWPDKVNKCGTIPAQLRACPAGKIFDDNAYIPIAVDENFPDPDHVKKQCCAKVTTTTKTATTSTARPVVTTTTVPPTTTTLRGGSPTTEAPPTPPPTTAAPVTVAPTNPPGNVGEDVLTSAWLGSGFIAWGCFEESFTTANHHPLPELIDGIHDYDARDTCDSVNVVGFDTVARRYGKFKLFWHPADYVPGHSAYDPNTYYSFAYSSDGVHFKRFGECDNYNGQQQAISNGMFLNAPTEAFRYLAISTECSGQNLREVIWMKQGPTTLTDTTTSLTTITYTVADIDGYVYSHEGYWDSWHSLGSSSSPQACADFCSNTEGCEGFDWNKAEGGCFGYSHQDWGHNVTTWEKTVTACCFAYTKFTTTSTVTTTTSTTHTTETITTTTTAFSKIPVDVLDLTQTDQNFRQFCGGFTDLKYGYLVPCTNGKVVRFDLASFGNVKSIDLARHDPLLADFKGGFTDGTYGYLVPGNNRGDFSSKVPRFQLENFRSIQVLDLAVAGGDLKSFCGGFSDGTYGYLAHSYLGKVPRFDLATFRQVEVLSLPATDGGLKGFCGGFAAGAYGYLSPSAGSRVPRFDLATFKDVAVLDLEQVDADLKGFKGGFTDGTYGYLVPGLGPGSVSVSNKVPRFKLATFGDVEVLNASTEGFDGGFTDGRNGYLVPLLNRNGYTGELSRFNMATFHSMATFDLTAIDPTLRGFQGGFTDGTYGYLVPHHSGKVPRFEVIPQAAPLTAARGTPGDSGGGEGGAKKKHSGEEGALPAVAPQAGDSGGGKGGGTKKHSDKKAASDEKAKGKKEKASAKKMSHSGQEEAASDAQVGAKTLSNHSGQEAASDKQVGAKALSHHSGEEAASDGKAGAKATIHHSGQETESDGQANASPKADAKAMSNQSAQKTASGGQADAGPKADTKTKSSHSGQEAASGEKAGSKKTSKHKDKKTASDGQASNDKKAGTEKMGNHSGQEVASDAQASFSASSVQVLDLSESNSEGYCGGFTDGKYGYLVPCFNGIVPRFELATFSPITVLDISSAGADLTDFHGGFADGTYGYLLPGANRGDLNGKVARFDLKTFGKVEILDLTQTDADLRGFCGGFTDGTYGYLSHSYNGKVPRFDLATFSKVEVMDLTATNDDLTGHCGGFADGNYGYLSPSKGSKVPRFDLGNFSKVEVLDLQSADAGLEGFYGGFGDGTYGYLVPGFQKGKASGKVPRFDLATFRQVTVLDLAATDSSLEGFGSGFTDGTYGYLVPLTNREGYTGRVPRFDLSTFKAVAVLDLADTDPELKGFKGGFTDGAYGYLVPELDGAASGRVPRFEVHR